MANSITICRIVFSVIMLFSKTFSPAFYICYLMAGFTDMIDGAIARKLGTESVFGEKLDTVADIILFVAAAVKIIPAIDISKGILIWISAIALIKIINVVSGIIMYKQFVAVHSIMNKVTGAILFVFPLTIVFIPLVYSTVFICAVATFATVQEGHLIRTQTNLEFMEHE